METQYQKRMRKLREAFGNKCQCCGSTQDLHFDHIDPSTKKAAVGDLARSNGFKRCMQEAIKCQLLCKSCHIEKSILNKDYTCSAKYHLIKWKDGKTLVVHSLDTWAKENGYHDGHLRAVRRGQRKSHKGIVSIQTFETKEEMDLYLR